MRGRDARRNRFTHPGSVAISRALMRSVIGGLVVALLAAEPALAGAILYATAASQQRIDGFCLGADGALAATPAERMGTAGSSPRRLLVGNGVLYVAEANQIEAFRIGAHGELLPHGHTDAVDHLEPKDLALNPDGKTLYVTHQGFLEAFALDAEGRLPPKFTSCVQGENINDFLDAQVANGLLYVSADDTSGRIAIYRLNADGSLPQTGCGRPTKKDRPEFKTWDSVRKRLQRPKAFVVAGGFIYVEERPLHRITAFRLQPDGTFCDRYKDENGNVVAESCGDPAYFLPAEQCARRQAKKQRQQCAASKTADVLQYEDLVLHGETLLGAQYFKGRVDAYRLQPEKRLPDAPRIRLPKQPTFVSETNPAMTPVRLTATDKAVYVAGGELDRVVAFHLNSHGVPVDTTPFSRTDEQTDSFPNDVAVAMLSAACQ
jgi:6-phosphogluconolactonase (cycloisomerase 2 family)